MKNYKYFLTKNEFENFDLTYPSANYTKEDDNVWFYDEDFIIMTSESNPEVMSICYNQGWAAKPDYMLKSEAEEVTDIGNAFLNGIYCSYEEKNISIKSFDEFKYFKNVTSLERYAFSQQDEMISIKLPNNLQVINPYAFSGCFSLMEINLPNNLQYIGDGAFINCDKIKSIHFPKNVNHIGNLLFNNISYEGNITSWGLLYITVDKDNKNYTDLDNNIVINKNTNEIILGCGGSIIPSSIRNIPSKLFMYCRSLSSITIPNSITSIGDGAFGGCYFTSDSFINNSSLDAEANNYWGGNIVDEITEDGLCIKNNEIVFINPLTTSVTVPSYVTSIKDNIFNVSCSIEYIRNIIFEENSQCASIGEWAFTSCDSLTSITIPNSVTSIGNCAFNSCSSLISIDIPNSITSIGSGTFTYCKSLTSVTIPNSVTYIGKNAFSECYSLNSITIPNSVNSIDYAAFQNCDSLTSITISNSVTTIGEYAFSYCDSLTSITIPNSITSIGDAAFLGCYFTLDSFVNNSSLDAEANKYWGATIVDEITEDGLCIKNNEIIFCTKITESVTITNSITSIGSYAFNKCEKLKEIIFEEETQLTSIGEGAFIACTSLTNITIPEGITSIGNYAFVDCESLNSITIPNSVTSIGTNAFRNCYSLSEIICFMETAPIVSSDTFSNIPSLGVLYYPSLNSSYETWKQYLPNWDFISL